MDISKGGNYHDFSGLAALRVDAQQDSQQAIEPVAKQFEALFLQMMLKSMRDAVPEGGLFDSRGGELYQEMHDKQLAVTLSEQGGIGLADAIAKQLATAPAGAASSGLSEQGAQLRQKLLAAAQVGASAADVSVSK
ncbi:rod-binding protein [Spongiibacter sp.]|uniref:rod-binding protein n=1 Tax=Spongiibacter sp. TaxID=2024860 RepID=UPI003567A8C4